MVHKVSKPSYVSLKTGLILRADIYPSYLKVQKGFSSDQASVATIIGQCGAIVGGAVCGYYSQFFGRRLTVVVACCFGACIIPLWTIPNTWGPIVVGTFLIQAAVNGAWGVMPIFLNEYAPPQFRGVFPGTVYQLGEPSQRHLPFT